MVYILQNKTIKFVLDRPSGRPTVFKPGLKEHIRMEHLIYGHKGK